MVEQKPGKKKVVVKLPDLTPKKDVKGGGNIPSKSPPLQIPPPGFFSSENGEPKQ
jgi:hypothetical protein